LGTGGAIRGRVGSIRSLAIGSARIDGLQAAMIDEPRTMSEAGLPDIDGIVGASFLRHFRVTMDFPKKTVAFVMGGVPADASNAGDAINAADASRRVVVPLRRLAANRHLMTLDVTINDQGPHRFLLDTGADITLITKRVADGMALEHVRSSRIHGIGGPKAIDIVAATSIAVGNVRAAGPLRIGVIEGRIATADIDGLLGMDFLRLLRVTLDYQAPSLAFEQVRVAAPAPAQPVRVE
jgi:predicted aspartyl protease